MTQVEASNEGDDLEQVKARVQEIVHEMTQRIQERDKERQLNDKEKIVYPEESLFVKLDSNIKKNTAFVKKLKTSLTEGQRESLMKEFNSLNLSRYITEVTTNLVEAKVKMTDFPLLLTLCSALHRRYSEFSKSLFDTFMTVLPRKPADLVSLNVSKFRTDLRFFADLMSIGIFTLKQGLPVLGQVITLLIQSTKEAHQFLPILLSFVKNCGDDFLGVPSRSLRLQAEKVSIELPRSTLIPPEKQVGINNLMKEYLKCIIQHVFKEHNDIRRTANQNRKMLLTRGDIPTERREQYEQSAAAFQRLISSATQFADLIDEEFPQLPPDLPESSNDFESSDSTINIDVGNRFIGSVDSVGPDSLWEDEDSKSFYTSLIDLKVLIPSILYKDSCKDDREKEVDATKEGKESENDKSTKEGINDSEIMVTDDQDIDQDMDAVMAQAVTPVEFMEVEEESSFTEPVSVVYSSNQEETTKVNNKSDSKASSSIASASTITTTPIMKQSMSKILMDSFTSSLLSCVNRDMIDKSAVTFCTSLNTKNNRNKLIRFLFSVPRSRFDLLPFYARLVKTLKPVMPHVANDLVDLLKQDFRYHVKKKDQINIESKIKSVRFIAEMVKFDLFPKFEALFCLKMLLHDFSHHQIEMTCAFLETCGRFLYRSKETHPRMVLLMEQMMKKKALVPSDSRYVPMIENAYYATIPNESGTSVIRIERPPMQEYIRKLIYSDLNRSKGLIVLKQLKKLNWKDEQTSDYIVKTLISCWNVKFPNIRFLASLVSALKPSHNDALVQVVDGVLEDVRLMMEVNQPKFNQRRIAVIKYLGELYIYRVVDSNVIFQELYSLITFGSGSTLDPPDHLFRIRLVCQLLESCGVYFASAATKKKLDCFLIYFQQYYWMKKSQTCFSELNPFPVTIDILFTDTVKLLRPKFKFCSNLEESSEEVVKLLNQLKPKVIELYPQLKSQLMTPRDSSSSNHNLAVIQEEGNEDSNTDFRDEDEESEEDDEDNIENEEDALEESSSSEEDEEDHDNLLTGAGDTPEEHTPLVRPKFIPCPEDDVFAKEFDKLVSDSLVSRAHETAKTTAGDIFIPIDADSTDVPFKPKKMLMNSSEDETHDEEEEETFNLKVMTRPTKGSKAVIKVIPLPVSSDLAITLREQEETQKREKDAFKRLTLKMNERIDEEDAQEQRVHGPGNQYFSKKKYYPHPKGAPDAEAIFGSS
jgi:regulator of nonsense transcripts 2